MFILTAEPTDDGHTYKLVQGDRVRMVSTDRTAVAERMLELGIDDPLPLIAAARKWGIVHIKE